MAINNNNYHSLDIDDSNYLILNDGYLAHLKGNVYSDIVDFIDKEAFNIERQNWLPEYNLIVSLLFGILENYDAAIAYSKSCSTFLKNNPDKIADVSQNLNALEYYENQIINLRDIIRNNCNNFCEANTRIFFYSDNEIRIDKLWILTNYISYKTFSKNLKFEYLPNLDLFKKINKSNNDEVIILIHAHSASNDGELKFKINGIIYSKEQIIEKLFISKSSKQKAVFLYNCNTDQENIIKYFLMYFDHVFTSKDQLEIEYVMLFNYIFFSIYRINGSIKDSFEFSMFYVNSLFKDKNIFRENGIDKNENNFMWLFEAI